MGGPLHKFTHDASAWADDAIRANEIFADLSAMDALNELNEEMGELLEPLYEVFKKIMRGEIS